MESSAEFFATPALVAILVTHLDIKSLARLAKTNRALRSRCVPMIWNNVDLMHIPNTKKVKSYVGQLMDLRTRAFYVRLLKICKECLVLYCNGVKGIPLEFAKHPPWLPLPDPTTYIPDIIFQPMTRLTRLECLLGIKRMDYHIADAAGIKLPPLSGPPTPDNSRAIENLCWLLHFNPGLTHLKVTAQEIDSPLHVRILARAIGSLKKLEHLELRSVVGTDAWRDALPTIFMSCPESLVSLVIRAGSPPEDAAPQVNPAEDDLDVQEGPLVLRQGPLPRLSKLTLVVYDFLDLSNYGTILRHTPKLATLEFQFLHAVEDTNLAAMAPAARAHCQYLRHFIVRQPAVHDPDSEMIQLMAGLNPILETLSYENFQDESSLFAPVLQRHSRTLRDIQFRSCQVLRGKTIHSILTHCVGLQRLQILSSDGSPGGDATIEELVADEWVCRNLRHLEMAVYWGEFEDKQPYHQQAPKSKASKNDQDRWNLLEKLYRQIGALDKLEVLGLQAGIDVSIEEMDEEDLYEGYEDDVRHQAAFPQLFSLGNTKTRRRGYLSWLAGLTQLKELRGSVHMVSPEIAATLGKKEILWMIAHWPDLRVIELVEYLAKVPTRSKEYPQLNLFMKRLPGIDICRPVPLSPYKPSVTTSPYDTDIFTMK
ncbi:hypothetical protein BGX29_004408 [Mortierella sp. GBA35]|nr:hypothetical protein BGX29_004408 [Mortierella sp. GBA35]